MTLLEPLLVTVSKSKLGANPNLPQRANRACQLRECREQPGNKIRQAKSEEMAYLKSICIGGTKP